MEYRNYTTATDFDEPHFQTLRPAPTPRMLRVTAIEQRAESINVGQLYVPSREVTCYYSEDGQLLAISDPVGQQGLERELYARANEVYQLQKQIEELKRTLETEERMRKEINQRSTENSSFARKNHDRLVNGGAALEKAQAALRKLANTWCKGNEQMRVGIRGEFAKVRQALAGDG